LIIQAQLDPENQLDDNEESHTKFIIESIRNSKFIKWTKDRKAIKPKMKYYHKKAAERLDFVICMFTYFPLLVSKKS